MGKQEEGKHTLALHIQGNKLHRPNSGPTKHGTTELERIAIIYLKLTLSYCLPGYILVMDRNKYIIIRENSPSKNKS